MKKNDFTGWKEVYAFNLIQTVKGKGFVITTVILCLVALLSFPVINLIMKGEDVIKIETIQTVYVVNDSGLPLLDFSGLNEKDDLYKGITFTNEERTLNEVTKELEEAGKEDKALLLHVTWEEEGFFNLNFITGTKSGVKEKDVTALSEGASGYFEDARLHMLEIEKEQMDRINVPIETKIVTLGEDGILDSEKEDSDGNGITMEQYYILLGGIVLLVFIIAFSGESVAVSIITEKSSRVIEYLMTSIRPLAIISGKILSMLTIIITQVLIIGFCANLSAVLSTTLLGREGVALQSVGSLISKAASSGAVSIQPLHLILSILIVVCGFLFYGTLAGLVGASVSKMEEMAEGLKVYNFAMIIGAYMGIALGMMAMSGSSGTGMSAFQIFCYLFPISSPFVLPASLLIGQASFGLSVAGFVILLVSLVMLFMFVARVYEGLILYNGDSLKWKGILSMSKEGRGRS